MKLLSRLFVVMVAVLMAACATFHLGQFQYTHKNHYSGQARDIPIWVDDQFGEEDKLAIDDAVRKLNYALNGYIYLHIVDAHFNMEINKIQEQEKLNGWLFLKIKGDGPITAPTTTCFAFDNKIGGNRLYLIRDRLPNDKVFGVTLHEIGHLLGSDHNNSGLMYKYYSKIGFQCIDFDTMKNVSSYQGLFVDNLNYCYDKEM
jgi:hypothetical protein